MYKIKSITISAKCSDLFSMGSYDENEKQVKDYSGYVPDFFPEEHWGDYVILDIDVKTGVITNWKPPTQQQLNAKHPKSGSPDENTDVNVPTSH